MTKLIWHIDRAKFQFQYEAEYQSWRPDPQVFFELGSSSADDVGAKIFVGLFGIKIYEHVSNLNAFEYSEFTAYLGIQYLLQDGFSLYSYIIFAFAGVGSFDESERVTKEQLCRHFAGLVRDYHTAMNQLPL
ncbi:hypothetical protein [Marinobacterium sp. xm-a-152]|jgi:hypothetical protein|uniref:hypothetical protein n=1 Tax=Marinobacterium sp. xm-a-152 TaxID=2497733 RepID=UPI0015696EA4|nr:hypothetical protein [Marinobacterium sp. xm-a-152]NRP16363.1 hypothetical protein [Marinobacterium sp. xm-a-152]